MKQAPRIRDSATVSFTDMVGFTFFTCTFIDTLLILFVHTEMIEGSFLENHEKGREKRIHKMDETSGMQGACISVLPIKPNTHIILDASKGCKNGVISVPFYIYLFCLVFITQDTTFPQVVLPLRSYTLEEQKKCFFGEDILT